MTNCKMLSISNKGHSESTTTQLNMSMARDSSNNMQVDIKGESWLCRTPIIWKNVIIMVLLHVASMIVFIEAIRGRIQLRTIIFFWFYAFWAAFGILAGAHRLFAHRSYEARLPLRILLMIMQTAALQDSIFDWCRNHRAHHRMVFSAQLSKVVMMLHRYSETSGDPHDSTRGIFFAHCGWLLCRKHPDVKRLGKNINMQDLLCDPVVRLQKEHFTALAVLFWLIVPVCTGVCVLQDSLWTCLLVNCWRYVISLHNTWLVNSLAHLHGARPYNRFIQPRENKLVNWLSLGCGQHNYHHTFPWSYRCSRRSWQHNFNLATAFIDFFAWLGLAYNLKVPNRSLVRKKMQQAGERGAQQAERCSAILDNIMGIVIVTWPIWTIACMRALVH